MGKRNARTQQQQRRMRSPIRINHWSEDERHQEERDEHHRLQSIDAENARPNPMQCFRTVASKQRR